MKAAMVKHNNESKGYWFEVPDHLDGKIQPGMYVICDTAFGRRRGAVVGVLISSGADEAKRIMVSSGAKFPLRQVVATEPRIIHIPIEDIKVPSYMTRSTPGENKIAKRFLEYYRTGQFNTRVAVNDDGVLTDGYTAYKVARMLHLTHLPAVVN